jgi:DHA1 family bicyclomycin/chloramphenicol resistance-like MFS transporter
MAFTLLLSFLVALPSFGIDMSLPALTAMGAALHVAPAQAGLMMSLFMLGFAVAPLFYGPASDRYGRKPVVVFACTLFIIAGIGCAFARSAANPPDIACGPGCRRRREHDYRLGHYP